VDASLSQADQEAVLAAIQTIRQKLPFLVDISPEERRSLLKSAVRGWASEAHGRGSESQR